MYSIMATIFLLVYYEIQSNVERERTGIYSHQDALYHQHNSLIQPIQMLCTNVKTMKGACVQLCQKYN